MFSFNFMKCSMENSNTSPDNCKSISTPDEKHIKVWMDLWVQLTKPKLQINNYRAVESSLLGQIINISILKLIRQQLDNM